MENASKLQILGHRIRALRLEKKLSQAKLAIIIYKDQQSIHKVETGKFNPTYLYLLEICDGLEITIDELLKDIQKKTEDKS